MVGRIDSENVQRQRACEPTGRSGGRLVLPVSHSSRSPASCIIARHTAVICARILRPLASHALMPPMHELPHFRTARLDLQRLCIDDLEACLAMDRDPEVIRYVGIRWTSQASHRSFLESRIGHSFPPGMGFWSVRLEAGFIGWIALMPLDLSGPEIEIGWRFVRHAWSRGYATEAARPILVHALQTLGLPEVVADVLPANAASIRVAGKLGMRPVGPALHNGYHVSRFTIGAAR